MDDNIHWKVIDNNSLHDLHEQLCVLMIKDNLAMFVEHIRAFSDPQVQINIDDLCGKLTKHRLHNTVYLAPN